MNNIRNFCIISHIDHGKSTLADRMIEITATVDKRKMREQVLDQMDLERERGITIKMQPVRMHYKKGEKEYVLNLIDTPGHIDFSYEVSRSLKAVEGVVLLVDSTQGVQAQTLTTLYIAQDLGLKVIPVLSKVDSPLTRVDEVKEEVSKLLNCSKEKILETSGKTGAGVSKLFEKIIEEIPASVSHLENSKTQALIFDFTYSTHRGIVVYVRVFSGEIDEKTELLFCAGNMKFKPAEIGIFTPEPESRGKISAGEIGYIVTGIKEADIASVGDTLTTFQDPGTALEGYKTPNPVVWASFYPESQDNFNILEQSLYKLRLSDSSLSFKEETSVVLGRGFHCGFLGMLHLEIIAERIKREFNIELIITSPVVNYEILYKDSKKEKINSPASLPNPKQVEKILEPIADLKIILSVEYMGPIMQILFEYEAEIGSSENLTGERIILKAKMPLRELMRGFFDRLKSVSSGFVSLSYEVSEMKEADVVRIDVLVAEEEVPAFSKIVSRSKKYKECEKLVEKLYKTLPKQLFMVKIQARVEGRIVAARKLSALRKDVTAKLYGGDVTRKRKLLERQKKGKKKMKERGAIDIPHDVFLRMIKEN